MTPHTGVMSDIQDHIIPLQRVAQDTNHVEGHCLQTIRHYLRHEEGVDNEAKRVLRVRRLANEITEGDWKTPLTMMEKRSKRRRALHDIYEMYVQTSAGLMGEFNAAMTARRSLPDASAALRAQYKELVVYVNEELRKLRNRFNTSVNMVPAYDF